MKNLKEVLAKKPKDEWSSHVTGKRSGSKYSNRRTTKLIWAMRQRKYFRTKKNNLDTDSYVRCLTQQNCKGLKLVSTIFYQIFIFSPNDRPSKTMKNDFYFI